MKEKKKNSQIFSLQIVFMLFKQKTVFSLNLNF